MNYIVGTVYFIFSAIRVTRCYTRPRCQTEQETSIGPRAEDGSVTKEEQSGCPELPFGTKVHWFLFNLYLGLCTFVFIAYWVILAPARTVGFSPSLKSYLVIDRHGINFGLMLIDFVLNRIPIRLLHYSYTSLALLLYLVYNSIYWSATGRLFYGKWLDYGSHLGLVFGLVLGTILLILPLIQLAWFSLNRLKKPNSKNTNDANANIEFGSIA